MFYISSRGHSGTVWLAKQISKHPKVVCWHGTRSIPPAAPGINDLSPKDFVKGLKILEKQKDERIYGAVHGFHGTTIKSEIEKEGGKFAGIFRDPVSKISSFFYAYLWSRLSQGVLPEDYKGPTKELFNKTPNDKMIEQFEILKKKLKGKNRNIFNLIPYFAKVYIKNKKKNKISNKKIDAKELEAVILSKDNSKILTDLFFHICRQTFIYDYEIFKNCNANQMITMEKMVSDKTYYINNVWNYLIPELKDKAEVKDFEEKLKGHNPNINLNANQKFEQLPISFQKILTWFFSKQEKELIKFYQNSKYLIL